MIEAVQSIALSEWQTREPKNCEKLSGVFLGESEISRGVAEKLSQSRIIELTELRTGLKITTFSYVGRVQIGNMNLVVLPKLRGSSMLQLLRYAYGFRKLNLVSDTIHFNEPCGFEDLLIAQLNAEAEELLSRGLQRSYIAKNELLESPRGRIDIQQFARQCGTASATLPCTHFPRVEDTLLNRVLLSGLKLAGMIASNKGLRRESRRLTGFLDQQVSPMSLNSAVMNKVDQQLNRLSKNYKPAMSIIRLLMESQGIALDGDRATTRLPGFMFDMNAFYQAILSRFLCENLTDYSVIDELSLKSMMRYNPNFTKPRRAPTPRPDYVIKRNGRTCSILDAKYRDIWEKDLPRHMLYQLVVYAISRSDQPQSAILYPTFHRDARKTCIEVMDPVGGNVIGEVWMCPVDLEYLQDLVHDNSEQGQVDREAYALRLAQLVS